MTDGSNLGWRLVFFAGLIPCAAGLVILALAVISSMDGGHGPWRSLMGVHPFSAAQMSALQPPFWPLWILTNHLAGVNLAMSGATIAVMARYAPRDPGGWAWWFLLAMILWVGGNDVAALLYYRSATGAGVPVAILPLTLGLLGLTLARRA
jgi:hypothetical protein